MSQSPPTPQDIFRKAGPLIGQRKEEGAGPLPEDQRNAIQDATLTIVAALRNGRSPTQVCQEMVAAGWQEPVALGFIQLVSQLVAKMYVQRSLIMGLMALVTSMLASVLIPTAAANEFSWLAAGVVTLIAIICILGTVRNFQLWRKYRQKK